MSLVLEYWPEIIIPAIAFISTLVAGYFVWRIGWSAFDRWVRKAYGPESGIVGRVARKPFIFLCLFAGFIVALQFFRLSEVWMFLVSRVLWCGLLVFLSWAVIKMGSSLVAFYSTRWQVEPKVVATTRSIGLVLVLFIAMLIVINIWGFTTVPVFVIIGVFSLLIILAFRPMMPDFLAGFQLSTAWQIKKNDYIRLGTGEEGYVVEIGWMRTRLKAPDESIVLVANSKMVGSTVVNLGPQSMKVEYDRLKVYADRIEALMKEIENQRDEFQSILSSMAEGIVVLDATNRIVSLNPASERLFGRPSEELVGNDIKAYLDLSKSEITDILVHQADGDVQPVRKKIDERVFSINLQSVKGQEGQLGRVVCAIRDITELDRVDQMKTEFVSMVSHELRTPLTSIKGYVDMVLDGEAGEINEEQTNYLEVARASTDRLITLVNELLDVSRIEAGGIELRLRTIVLQDMVRSVAVSLRTQIEKNKIVLKLDMPRKSIRVYADSNRVTEVLTNLLSNACNYSPVGASITVKTRIVDGQAQVDVTDTGIGISPEDQDKIFAKFYRVDNSMTKQVSGTGLGLSVARSLVEMQGGRIWLKSKLNKGSTFSFTIPLAPGDNS